jgi:CheY-like chemotaxis protein
MHHDHRRAAESHVRHILERGAAMQPVRKRILCVDYDSDSCTLISTMLGQVGFEVEPASGVAEALELLKDTRFDLYLLERRLPDGSGIDLCRQIRGLDPHAPILFFAAIARKQDRELAVSAGAQGYLAKPEGVFDLVEVVSRLSSGTSGGADAAL